jgi:hypothetical protein
VSGGLPQTLCDLPSVAVGGSWNRNGDIIFGNITGGLLRVRETGGGAIPITILDPVRHENFHLLPSFLPDGRHFIYLRVSPTAPEAGGTYIGTLDAKPEEQSTQRLMPVCLLTASESSLRSTTAGSIRNWRAAGAMRKSCCGQTVPSCCARTRSRPMDVSYCTAEGSPPLVAWIC